MRTSKEKRMTSGSPGKLILLFALPLMLGQIFQQLYVVVDTMVIGRALGVEALAAIGSTDWYSWLTVGLITGFTQGFGILIAQKFGEKDDEGLNRITANSLVLSALLAVLFLLLLELSVPYALQLLQIPVDIRFMSSLYLRIIFGGIPISMAYNILAVILRSLGDARSPLHAMVIATITNVVLDLFFVLGLHMGVAGAAAATLIGQGVSAVYCWFRFRRLTTLHIRREDLRLYPEWSGKMLKLGIPVALQNVMIAVGGIILQSIVDGFGVLFIAGFIATNKLYGLLECAAVAYGFAMVTYVGQNLGAGEIGRIRSGWRWAVVIALGSCACVGACMILGGRSILSLFISAEAEDGLTALNYAYDYLKLMVLFLPVLYLLHITRSSLQGMGHTVIAMVSGIFELIMRVGSALLLPGIMGQYGLFYSEILAWAGADLVLLPGYFHHLFRLLKQENGK